MNAKSRIREELLQTQKISYASDEIDIPEGAMLCRDGVNPYGCPEEVLNAMGFTTVDEIMNYPHNQSAYNAICAYWKAWAHLTKENILLTEGSFAAIFVVNNIFAKKGAKVLGIAPQFSDYVANAQMLGMQYTYVPLKREDNYAFNLDELLAAIKEDISVMYLDNPNNPTGQLISTGDIEKILKRAQEKNVYVILDEAYGDFVMRSESAIRFLDKYDNLIVLRTFSKGFGMAGLRSGYALASHELIGYMNQISCPYNIGETSRRMIAIALQNAYRLERDTEEFAAAKNKVRAALGEKLKMAATEDRVPIFLLYHEDPKADVYRLLLENGIIAVQGSVFASIDDNCVRVRLPADEDFPAFMELLKRAAKQADSSSL